MIQSSQVSLCYFWLCISRNFKLDNVYENRDFQGFSPYFGLREFYESNSNSLS